VNVRCYKLNSNVVERPYHSCITQLQDRLQITTLRHVDTHCTSTNHIYSRQSHYSFSFLWV